MDEHQMALQVIFKVRLLKQICSKPELPFRKMTCRSVFKCLLDDIDRMIHLNDAAQSIDAVLFGDVNHRLDILRLCLIKERPIAHHKATAFANRIDQFFAVISHLLGRA